MEQVQRRFEAKAETETASVNVIKLFDFDFVVNDEGTEQPGVFVLGVNMK